MLRRNKGFTLVEVMVCVVMTFIVVIMLFQVTGIFYIATEDSQQSVNVITQEQEAEMQQPQVSPKIMKDDPAEKGDKKSL